MDEPARLGKINCALENGRGVLGADSGRCVGGMALPALSIELELLQVRYIYFIAVKRIGSMMHRVKPPIARPQTVTTFRSYVVGWANRAWWRSETTVGYTRLHLVTSFTGRGTS